MTINSVYKTAACLTKNKYKFFVNSRDIFKKHNHFSSKLDLSKTLKFSGFNDTGLFFSNSQKYFKKNDKRSRGQWFEKILKVFCSTYSSNLRSFVIPGCQKITYKAMCPLTDLKFLIQIWSPAVLKLIRSLWWFSLSVRHHSQNLAQKSRKTTSLEKKIKVWRENSSSNEWHAQRKTSWRVCEQTFEQKIGLLKFRWICFFCFFRSKLWGIR